MVGYTASQGDQDGTLHLKLTHIFSVSSFQHKVVIAGNHELSFDPETLEEARDYMRQVGEEGDTHKVVTNISMLD